MKTARIATAIALVLMATSLAGCAATIATPPPPYRVETRPPLPFGGAVWLEGHYIYRQNRYIWEPGRYVRPPRPGAQWIPGEWRKHRHGWRWKKGHWDGRDKWDRRDRRDFDD